VDICLVLGVRGGCFYGADGEWREKGGGFLLLLAGRGVWLVSELNKGLLLLSMCRVGRVSLSIVFAYGNGGAG